MNVTDAVNARRSIRAFRPDPVDDETIARLLTVASRSPSGGNVQPWRIYVVNGASMTRFRTFLQDRPPGAAAYDIYPQGLTEPYRSSRFKIGEDMYATLGIAREDKPARFAQFAKNLEFFGAPAALFCFVDRQMGPPQWSDLGMYLQTVMLLAREHGLHTCPQEAWAVWHALVSEFLSLPPELMLFCGLSLGYRDESAPINTLRTERAPLSECATLLGFA